MHNKIDKYDPVCIISMVIAFMLNMQSWGKYDFLSPDFCAIILLAIIFARVSEKKISIYWGLFLGMIADAVSVSVMGIHMIDYVLLIYGANNLLLLSQLYSIWQLSLLVTLLLLFVACVNFILYLILYKSLTIALNCFFGIFISILLWPFIYLILQQIYFWYAVVKK